MALIRLVLLDNYRILFDSSKIRQKVSLYRQKVTSSMKCKILQVKYLFENSFYRCFWYFIGI